MGLHPEPSKIFDLLCYVARQKICNSSSANASITVHLFCRLYPQPMNNNTLVSVHQMKMADWESLGVALKI